MKAKILSQLLSKHCYEILCELINHADGFGIICPLDKTHFEPELDEKTKNNIPPLALFTLMGYTLQSAILYEEHISFEAGFGIDNVGSVVSVKYCDILQIVSNIDGYKENILFFNLFAQDSARLDSQNTQESENNDNKDDEDDLLNSSRDAFLSNPKNNFQND